MSKTLFELRNLVVPQFLYKESSLSLTAFKVYCFIHAYTNPFFFSNEHLGEMFGVHPETISTAIGQLEEKGYIRTIYTPKAGGGKIRLSEDTYSEQASSLSGVKKDEPTTKRNHLDKDKDNNIKGKILENDNDTDVSTDIQDNPAIRSLKAKEARRNKPSVFGSRKSSDPSANSERQPFPTKSRKSIDLSHI